MQFAEFATTLQKLESTAARNQLTEMLAEFLPSLSASEIKPAMYLLQGRLVPSFVDLEFNLSQKLALRTLAVYLASADEVMKSADNEAKVQKLFGELGDVGLVAEKLLSELPGAKEKPEINSVYSTLREIALLEGKGSQEGKMAKLGSLLLSLDPLSSRYVCRVVIGNLRLGLSDKTVLDALSWAKVGDKSLRKIIERAYGARADIGELAEIVLQTETANLENVLAEIRLKPGVPVAAKLVERERDAESIALRMPDFLVQPKLDGMRAQIHLDELGQVSIFSRNMESLTAMFPDIAAAARKLGVKSLIIDSEAIGYDFENDAYLPFQETMQRRRKYDVGEMADSIPVKAMAFDLLFIDGEDISQEPVELRVQKLRDILAGDTQKTIELLETVEMHDAENLDKYFREKIGAGLEGVIVKKLGTTYDPGTRNFDWIKFKANSQAEMVDTVDTVVLGYFRGRGVRAKFGIGALLVGVYNDADGKFYTTAKIGTGMKDEDLQRIKQELASLELDKQPENVVVNKILEPDVWVRPEIVAVIDADEITRSPGHTVAIDLLANFETDTHGRGLSLRFPRLKIWNRPDKSAPTTTSPAELVHMFELRRQGASEITAE